MGQRAQVDVGAAFESLPTLRGIEKLRSACGDSPAYLVGGAVRDLLLGTTPAELDVAVEGDVAGIAERLGGEVVAHERFSTATAEVEGTSVDLARTRTETYASPGALPDVSPAPMADDLRRRDFSVNAMAIQIAPASEAGNGPSDLIDLHGGLEDLRSGTLRVLHPASLVDDPTRAFRAARYSARLDLATDPETEALLRKADLLSISGDRYDAELRRIAGEPTAIPALKLLKRWGLIELSEADYDLARDAAGLAASEPWSELSSVPDAILMATGLLDMRGSFTAHVLAAREPESPIEGLEMAVHLTGTQKVVARAAGATWLDDFVNKWRNTELEIDGSDLMREGIEQGPAIGAGLNAALAAKLEGRASGRAAELAIALEAARTESG